jgi:uncharacterized surface protein with fasciclin (FAS1) repeats
MSDAQTLPNIVETAITTPKLSTLVAAVQAAELAQTLQGTGPFTVFAPINEAFDQLPEGTVVNLLKPENKDSLVKILTYHVVSGKVMSTDLSDGQEIETLQGQKLTVLIEDDKVSIVDAAGNTATVIAADLEQSNGVVHLIDKVVMP